MKYKRLIIALSSVIAVIVLGIILSFTLFRTNNICFDFQNETTTFESKESKAEIISSANINKSLPIYTLNKKEVTQNLEKHNPYLKVINIETIFPNKIIIHCAEREEAFCIKGRDDLYYICDDELKVLNITKSITISQISPVVISGVNVVNTGASAGDFLELKEGESLVKKISNAFAYNNKTITDIKAICKNITLKYEYNNYTCKICPTLIFTTYDDFKINIQNAVSYLVLKINIALNYTPQIATNYKSHELFLDINPSDISEYYCPLEPIKPQV